MSDLYLYILSQIFITISMLLEASTLFVFSRQAQLGLNIVTNVFYVLCYYLLGGYVAVAMGILAICRDGLRSVLNKLQDIGKIKPSRKRDGWLLVMWVALFTVGCAFTAHGALSILPYFSTTIFTISIWQSNLKFYRLAAVVTNSMMIVYNIFMFNIMGIVLTTGMSILAICGVISYYLHAPKPTHKTRKKRG